MKGHFVILYISIHNVIFTQTPATTNVESPFPMFPQPVILCLPHVSYFIVHGEWLKHFLRKRDAPVKSLQAMSSVVADLFFVDVVLLEIYYLQLSKYISTQCYFLYLLEKIDNHVKVQQLYLLTLFWHYNKNGATQAPNMNLQNIGVKLKSRAKVKRAPFKRL